MPTPTHAENLQRIFKERADRIKAAIHAGHSEDNICKMLPYSNNSIRRYIRKLATRAAKVPQVEK